MRSGTYKFIEQTLKDYNETDQHIKQRVLELTYPYTPQDENIGGGKSNIAANPVERLAITIADDLLLTNLKRNKAIVDSILNELEPGAKEIIKLYYINQPRVYTWEGIAQRTQYSEKQCRNIRNIVFERIASKLGMPI